MRLGPLAITSALMFTACGGGAGVDLLRYVPEDAVLVAGLDAGALAKSSLYADVLGPRLERAAPSLHRSLEHCEVGLETWKAIVFAAKADDGGTLFILNAPGLGRRSTLDCLAGQMTNAGKMPWMMSDDTHLVFGDGVGHVVDDDIVVVVSNTWSNRFNAVLGGDAETAKDGASGKLLARAKVRQPVWAAMRLDDTESNTEKALEIESPGAVAVLDLGDPLELSVTLEITDGSDPESVVQRARAQYDDTLREALLGFGVAPAAVESVELDHEGNVLIGRGVMSSSDVATTLSNALDSANQ